MRLLLADLERVYIVEAVRHLGVLGAAKELGIGKSTIYRKLREWGLRVETLQAEHCVNMPQAPEESRTTYGNLRPNREGVN